MKRTSHPTPGQTGPRRPLPPNPPHRYQRTPVRDLRALPIRENPRLTLLDYWLTDAPGLVNRTGGPRTHGHGAALLAGDFLLQICLTRDADGWFLETEMRCYDEQAAGRTDTVLSALLLADVYRLIQSRQTAAEGRAYGRGHGRN